MAVGLGTDTVSIRIPRLSAEPRAQKSFSRRSVNQSVAAVAEKSAGFWWLNEFSATADCAPALVGQVRTKSQRFGGSPDLGAARTIKTKK